MALITAAEARQEIPELTGTSEDTLLESLILQAGGMIARFCSYPPASAGAEPTMESASYTRYYDGPGGRILTLDVRPVTAVASIYDDIDLTWGADTLIASSNYAILDGTTGRVLLTATSGESFSGAEMAIKATFTAGYTTVPDSLKRAARELVKSLWTNRPTQRPDERDPGDRNALPRHVANLLRAGGYVLPRAYTPTGAS